MLRVTAFVSLLSASGGAVANGVEGTCGNSDADGVCLSGAKETLETRSSRSSKKKDQVLLQRGAKMAVLANVVRHVHASSSSSGSHALRRSHLYASESSNSSLAGCCAGCSGRAFCSPYSGNCYDSKNKDYYASCDEAATNPATPPQCCMDCASKQASQFGFFSPNSGNCYETKAKDYYQECPAVDCSGYEPPLPQCCVDCAGKLGFFSPNSGNCYKDKAKDYYQECPPDVNASAETGECKVGGSSWCAATVPDASFSLKSCPNLGMRIKAITYNLFWWNLFGQRGGNGGSAGQLVRRAAGRELFDIAGFQECDDPSWIMSDAGMTEEDYDYIRWGSNTLAFKKTRFEKLAQGDGEFVAQDFGRFSYRRGAHWVRLNETDTGNKLFVINHHGPLPVNTGGVCGGAATAYNLLKIIDERAEKDDAILFMGDFNADGGSQTVRTLQGYMHHLMNDWVDNFFSNCGQDSVNETKNLGTGGSDHNSLMVIIDF